MWCEKEMQHPMRFAWWSKVTSIMCIDRERCPPRRFHYKKGLAGFRLYNKERAIWMRDVADLKEWCGAVWHLRDQEQDLRQADRDAYVRKFRPVLTLPPEERQALQETQCARWWARRWAKAGPLIGAPHPWLGVAFALLLSCTYYQAAYAAETYDITNDRRQIVGDIYDPGHGRRLQIRDSRRRIIGYIEADGDITDTRRRKIGEVDDD